MVPSDYGRGFSALDQRTALNRGGGLLDKPFIGGGNTVAKTDRMAPSEIVQAANVESLSGHAVGLLAIEDELGLRVHDLAHHIRQLTDREVLTCSDVDVLRRVVAFHQEQAGVRQIVYVKKLTPGSS